MSPETFSPLRAQWEINQFPSLIGNKQVWMEHFRPEEKTLASLYLFWWKNTRLQVFLRLFHLLDNRLPKRKENTPFPARKRLAHLGKF
jgi:hypothetical protein